MSFIHLLVIQIVTFALIVLVLRKLLYSETKREIKRLKKINEENVKRAEELETRAKVADEKYKELIAKAEEEARKTRDNAETEVARIRDEMVNKAKEESAKIIMQAKKSKDHIRVEIESEMNRKVVDLACDIVNHFLSSKMRLDIHSELVTGLKNGLDNINVSNVHGETTEATIVTPIALDEQSKQLFEKTIQTKIGRQIKIVEQIDENLLAGLVIKLGNYEIDGSLKSKLSDISEQLKRSV